MLRSPRTQQNIGTKHLIPVTNAIERLREEFTRRIKTQTVLPSADTAAILFWALLAFGQINMRKICRATISVRFSVNLGFFRIFGASRATEGRFQAARSTRRRSSG